MLSLIRFQCGHYQSEQDGQSRSVGAGFDFAPEHTVLGWIERGLCAGICRHSFGWENDFWAAAATLSST